MTATWRLALATMASVALAAPASAQYFWGRGPLPGAGACFYEDINYGGRYFCAPLGEEAGRVPRGTNDEISSIRLFGSAEVIVFRADDMRGDSRRFTSSIRDLRDAGFNDRVSSFVVQRRGASGWGDSRSSWGGAYGGGGWGQSRDDDDDDDRGRSSYGGSYHGSYGNSHGGWGGAYGGGSYGSSHHSGGRYTYAEATTMVREAYRRVLKREPDPAAQPWINEVIKNNWSQRQLEDALRETPEGRSKAF